jgi:hypothetical protein
MSIKMLDSDGVLHGCFVFDYEHKDGCVKGTKASGQVSWTL